MLKIATGPEERAGADLLEWWDGDAAARVLARDGNAILIERATGSRDLVQMSHTGDDEAACRIVCAVVARLHAPRAKPLPRLATLVERFEALTDPAARHEGVLDAAAATARALLAAPRETVALHGDIHHGNILDFGRRGWLAIDPKGLTGERGFDYANLFCNPDAATAGDSDRFARRVALVGAAAGLDRRRLLAWVLAWSGLSAVWHREDGTDPAAALAVAQLAATALAR